VQRVECQPPLDHGVDRGAAVVAVGQQHDPDPAVGQQGQAGPPAAVGALVVGEPLAVWRQPAA
jgi:hypothetical protein